MNFEPTTNDVTRAWRAPARHALSLLELVAVITILGVIAAAATTRFGHDAIANSAAKGYARMIALDLLAAKRKAIGTGDDHHLQLDVSGGSVSGYTVLRDDGASLVVVDDYRPVPANVAITYSHADMAFFFDGSAGGGYVCTVAGPDRSWMVEVIQATGMVRVTET